MSEAGKDNFLHRLKQRIRKENNVKTSEQTPEETARETIILFANQEHQEQIATYYADSQSVFDLDQVKPSTILRVERNLGHFEEQPNSPDIMAYQWYVTGMNNKGERIVFEILFRTIAYYKKQRDTSNQLQLDEPWELNTLLPTKQSFPVRDFHTVVYGGGYMSNMTKIDIMSAGKTEKAPEVEKSNSSPKLNPVTEPI